MRIQSSAAGVEEGGRHVPTGHTALILYMSSMSSVGGWGVVASGENHPGSIPLFHALALWSVGGGILVAAAAAAAGGGLLSYFTLGFLLFGLSLTSEVARSLFDFCR